MICARPNSPLAQELRFDFHSLHNNLELFNVFRGLGHHKFRFRTDGRDYCRWLLATLGNLELKLRLER